uniref:Uncharacterized protein n=1 Tax=Anopheles atroparvus TaxID=41427 RepID=A0A182JA37_ANOAO
MNHSENNQLTGQAENDKLNIQNDPLDDFYQKTSIWTFTMGDAFDVIVMMYYEFAIIANIDPDDEDKCDDLYETMAEGESRHLKVAKGARNVRIDDGLDENESESQAENDKLNIQNDPLDDFYQKTSIWTFTMGDAFDVIVMMYYEFAIIANIDPDDEDKCDDLYETMAEGESRHLKVAKGARNVRIDDGLDENESESENEDKTVHSNTG